MNLPKNIILMFMVQPRGLLYVSTMISSLCGYHTRQNDYENNNNNIYCFILSVMPPKDLAHFSYISPQKYPLSTTKYELTVEFLSAKA